MFLNDQITCHLGVDHLPFNAVTSEKPYILQIDFMGKKILQGHIWHLMTLYIYVREKKLYDQRFGEKNKLPISSPPPPPKSNGWPLMSATVEWLATIEWGWLGYELQNFSYPTKAEFNIVLLFLQNNSRFKNKQRHANLSQFKFSLRGIFAKQRYTKKS